MLTKLAEQVGISPWEIRYRNAIRPGGVLPNGQIVDDSTGLVETLDFDYIMNSQAIWGCYGTVPALRISELYRPADARVVTVIHYTWNGHERILDEQ